MRSTALILAQAGLISLLAVYGAFGESTARHTCPLPETTTGSATCHVPD
ncbi:hypothetical protein [uncultured Roseovarius sp.]|nr:hypothetical protein [uncultured Roseovarius sp.]